MIRDPLEADTQVFATLQEAGCDFTKEHVVDFLFLGEDDALKKIRETLEGNGFYLAETQNPGELLMHNKMILHLPLMQQFTVELDRLAEVTGTEYDGWGTQV